MSIFFMVVRLSLVLWANVVLSVAQPSLSTRSRVVKPAPVVFAPSQNFKGNDGPWSTFILQIGSPPQDMEVQISTKSYQTIVVLPGGCISTDPSTCPSDRGGQGNQDSLFNPISSTSWKPNTVVPNSTFTLNLETNLGYNDNGLYGYDTVQLGWQGSGGPSQNQQIVAGIETKDFFLGFFGLNPHPTNFTTFNDPAPSFLTSLFDSDEIPSLSWSYTAGNQYRPGNVLGSLTLGGYDAGRFIPNKVTFPFNSVDERDLTVIIENIQFKSTSGPALVPDGYGIDSSASVAAFIDSTTPYFWLPLDACQAFEKAFDLTWNDTVQAYLVNDTLHTALKQQNTSITFTLGTTNGTENVEITLPYGAFDLEATYPLITNSSRYFPLMRATNESQYTLGRAFLQDAYLIADYERRNFSVSQCEYPMKPERIIAIERIGEHNSGRSRGLSSGAIAGIVVGSVAAMVIMVMLGVLLKRNGSRMLKLRSHPEMNELVGDGADLSGGVNKHSGLQEIDGGCHQGNELDGVKLPGHEMDGGEYPGQELGNTEHRFELDGVGDVKHEMPAVESTATELPQPTRPPSRRYADESPS